jgi:hypothetical protein
MNLKLPLILILASAVQLMAGTAVLPQTSTYSTATAPVNGTNEVQQLTFDAAITGGTFKLQFGTYVTGSITWTATDANLLASIVQRLQGSLAIGSGGLNVVAGSLSGGHGTVNITFNGAQTAKLDVAQISVQNNSLTGTTHTLTVSTTTPGVTADGRLTKTGSLDVALDTKALYVNTGTPPNPVWEVASP